MKNQPHRALSHYANSQNRYVFTVIRNPFDRAISLYHWYRELHLTLKKKRTPHNAAMNLLARGCSSPSEFWVKFISPDALKFQYRYSPMLRSQMFYIGNFDWTAIDSRVDLVIPFEDISSEFEPLVEKFGFLELPHLNSSSGPADELSLTDEAKDRVRELYAEDFNVLYPDL